MKHRGWIRGEVFARYSSGEATAPCRIRTAHVRVDVDVHASEEDGYAYHELGVVFPVWREYRVGCEKTGLEKAVDQAEAKGKEEHQEWCRFATAHAYGEDPGAVRVVQQVQSQQ